MKAWTKYLAMFALAAALSGFAMSFAITYKSDGLYEGLSLGEQELDEHFAAEHAVGEKVQFSGGMDTYQLFTIQYGWIGMDVWRLRYRSSSHVFYPSRTRIDHYLRVRRTSYSFYTLLAAVSDPR